LLSRIGDFVAFQPQSQEHRAKFDVIINQLSTDDQGTQKIPSLLIDRHLDYKTTLCELLLLRFGPLTPHQLVLDGHNCLVPISPDRHLDLVLEIVSSVMQEPKFPKFKDCKVTNKLSTTLLNHG
jgi:hypothetical protein